MSLLWSLFITISPALALLCYFYERDSLEGKTHGAKVKVFLLGISSAIPIGILESLSDYLFNSGKFSNYLHQYQTSEGFSSLPFADALLMGFLWSAAIEEGIKLLYVLLFVKRLKEFSTKNQAIIYTVILGLGFATLENILYVVSFQQSQYSSLGLALARAFLSLPMHVICAVAMGFLVGRAEFSQVENKTVLFLGAWGLATLVHGTYNTSAFINTPLSLLLGVLIVIVGVSLSIKLVITLSKQEKVTAKMSIDAKTQSTPASIKLSVRDSAKQGNPKAIAALMNHSLQPKGINAKVALEKDCLQVMLESERVPATSLVGVIRKGLISLGVESIKQVKVYGRQAGEDVPDWHQEFELVIPIEQEKADGRWQMAEGIYPDSEAVASLRASADSMNNKNSTAKSQQRKVSKANETKWKTRVFLGTVTAVAVICISYSVPQVMEIITTVSTGNSNPTAFSQSNLTLDESKQYETELVAAQKAIEANSNDYQAWYNRGEALFKLERYQAARRAYEKAIKINPNYAEAWSERSYTLRKLGRFDEALMSSERAIQINPNFAQGWKNHCGSLIALERNQEALAACDKAIQLKPDLPPAWYNRGIVLMKLSQYEEAVISFDKATQIKPDYYKSWHDRALALSSLQQYEEALASFDKVIQIIPNDAGTWYNRGNTLVSLRRDEEALASYEKAIQIKPDFYQAWINRGGALQDLQRYQEAIASYDKALEIGNIPAAWYGRGVVLEQLGRYEEALTSYDNAIQIYPNYTNAIKARNHLLLKLRR